MIVSIIPVLFIALILYSVYLQKRGMAGWKALLVVLAGTALIVFLAFGLLFIGFRNFG